MKLWILLWLCSGNCVDTTDGIQWSGFYSKWSGFYSNREHCEDRALNSGYTVTTEITDMTDSCHGMQSQGFAIGCGPIQPHKVKPYVTYGVCQPLATPTGEVGK